jgi:hypothetical protein
LKEAQKRLAKRTEDLVKKMEDVAKEQADKWGKVLAISGLMPLLPTLAAHATSSLLLVGMKLIGAS